MPRRDARTDERPDDGLIHAWLDGELGAEESARVERLVAERAAWAAAAAEARGLVAASTRILGALDVVAGDVIPRGGNASGVSAPTLVGSRVPAPRLTTRRVPTWLRVAAGVVLVAGVGYLGIDRSDDGRPAASAAAISRASGAADAVSGTVTPAVALSASRGVASTATTPPSASQDTRRADAAKERDAAFAQREASVAESPLATPSPTGALVRQESATATTRGVAAGIASGVVTLPSAETRGMLGATTAVTEREARAKTTQRASSVAPSARSARALDSPSAVGAVLTDRAAESIGARVSVTGCWRAETTAGVDSIQTSLRLVRMEGDTLVLALTPVGAEAWVVWESNVALRGTARGIAGIPAPFRAYQTMCLP